MIQPRPQAFAHPLTVLEAWLIRNDGPFGPAAGAPNRASSLVALGTRPNPNTLHEFPVRQSSGIDVPAILKRPNPHFPELGGGEIR
jgi:hypothetical protein